MTELTWAELGAGIDGDEIREVHSDLGERVRRLGLARAREEATVEATRASPCRGLEAAQEGPIR
jgi:hypothetical protein